MPRSIAASVSGAVRPGLTMKRAPASMAASRSQGLSTVPAPTTAPSTRAIARITSRAAGVRRVTSRAVSPPSTRARAIGSAWLASSTTRTGITGTERISASMLIVDMGFSEDVWFGSASEAGGGEHRGGTLLGPVRPVAHEGEELAPRARGGGRRRRRLAGGEFLRVDEHLEAPLRRAEPHDVAVADPADRPAADRLRAEMDRGRDLAGGARHAPVRHQRDLVAAVLQH